MHSENTRGEEWYESFFRRFYCVRVLVVVAAVTLAVPMFNLVAKMTMMLRFVKNIEKVRNCPDIIILNTLLCQEGEDGRGDQGGQMINQNETCVSQIDFVMLNSQVF